MAKGDKWIEFGVFKTREGAVKAKGGKKGYRITKAPKTKYNTKGKGFALYRLWTPVKGQKDYWGMPLYKPKVYKKKGGRK